MSAPTILVCETPTLSQWQLGPLPPPAADVILIGWHVEPRAVDAGVPPGVADVLARALTSVATLTFPVVPPAKQAIALSSSDDTSQPLHIAGLAAHARAAVHRGTARTVLVSTHAVDTAKLLFDAPGYAWDSQAQVVLISEHHAPAPIVSRDTLQALAGDNWIRHAATEQKTPRAHHLVGVMRPGVDGDIAGILSLTPAFTRSLTRALQTTAHRAGFAWQSLSEQAFTNAL